MTSRAAEGVLVGAMWSYAQTVLAPAQALKRSGVPVVAPPEGEDPVDVPAPGLGPRFSAEHDRPVLLESATEHDALVEEFDRMGEVYEAYVRPFSTPIFDEAVAVLETWLSPDARLLDAGCGSGRELRRMARLVPDGEVVGIDLAAGMVTAAHRSARAHGLDHCAFFQADVGDCPPSSRAPSTSSTARSPTITTPTRRRRRARCCAACDPAGSTASSIPVLPGSPR